MIRSEKKGKETSFKLKLRKEAELLFEKKFQYQKPMADVWALPLEESPFSEFYQFESLQNLKHHLNAVKSRLNDYGTVEWDMHTRRRDPLYEVTWRLRNKTKTELVTVAWCKFFECLHRYPLVTKPELNSLHLCEAPGAFICALNHYLQSTYSPDQIKWNWRSTTLNPYYEGNTLRSMITDDRLIFHTIDNWYFHKDFTGNLRDIANIEDLAEQCAKDLKGGVQLCTADGSFDCANKPESQEEMVTHLFFAQMYTALKILSAGGNYVHKMFTLFESCSVSILYFLNCVFRQVHLFKPVTGKRGNSEIYVICLDYQRDTPGLEAVMQAIRTKLAQPNDAMIVPLFTKAQIPSDFLTQHEVGCRIFLRLQEQAIDNSIYLYEVKDPKFVKHQHFMRQVIADMYYSRYKVKDLPDELRIVKQFDINKYVINSKSAYLDSYTDRGKLKHGNLLDKICNLRRELNAIQKDSPASTRYNHCKQRPAPLKLHLYRGAPVGDLLSSLFAWESVLNLRLHILETLQFDPIWQMGPKCFLFDDKNNNTHSFDYAPSSDDESTKYHKAQRRFFVMLIESLLAERPAKIVFQRFLFLSHYAASVLLFLAELIYRQTEIETSSDLQSITLSGFLDEDATMEQLQQLHTILLSDKDADSEVIHCVLHLHDLHKNEFSQALTMYNNGVLEACFDHMLGSNAAAQEADETIKETTTVTC